MLAFVEGRADVLVATTIIENGLDIPRANTLIVNRADRYGLAQLYQLRGRVGRSDRRAFAYLLVPPDTVLSEIARKRLAAIREFSDLGAGFRIAALDLELRGAGNLLGGEQSGHIQAVGLDLYVKLLEQTILELHGRAVPRGARAPPCTCASELRIPPDYVPETHQRLSIYKRVSQLPEGRGRRCRCGPSCATATGPPRRGGGAPPLRGAARPRRGARPSPRRTRPRPRSSSASTRGRRSRPDALVRVTRERPGAGARCRTGCAGRSAARSRWTPSGGLLDRLRAAL